MGAVTAVGHGVDETWAGLVAGRSGVRPIDIVRPGPGHLEDRRGGRRLRRQPRPRPQGDPAGRPLHPARPGRGARGARCRPACRAASRAAWPRRPGSSSGTGLGGVNTLCEQIAINATRGPDRVSPFFIPMAIPNVGAGQLSITFGAMGPSFAVVSACATRRPRDRRVVGDHPARRRRHDDRRRRRGRRPGGARGRLLRDARAVDPERRPGWGVASVRPGPRRLRHRRGLRSPGPRGARARPGAGRRAAGRAGRLRRDGRRDAHHPARAGWQRGRPGGPPGARSRPACEPTAIDHVNAHATSTAEGDKAELLAIRTIFGDARPEVAVTANKSMLGHTLGAAGAIEAVVDDPDDPDRARAADDQPDRSRRAGRRPRPDAPDRRPGARSRTALEQLVRVRRPEHCADLQPVRRMTDERAGRAARRGSCRGGWPGFGLAAPDRSLLGLVDRLAVLLERSELTELEVEAGGTGLVLRKAAALVRRRLAAPSRRTDAATTVRPALPRRRTCRRRRPAVGQGAADRHLLHLASARLGRLRPGPGARSPSAR